MHSEANLLELDIASFEQGWYASYPNCYIPSPKVPNSSAIWFWRRFLKGFYHIRAWQPPWSCVQDHLNKLLLLSPKDSPYEIKV